MAAAECIHGIEDARWCTICNGRDRAEQARGRAMRPEWAAVVRSWIPAIGSDWISGDDLADVTGLTRGQVGSAVAYLRDSEPDFPLVSGPEGYRFSIDEADVNRYQASAVRTAQTRIRRSWRGVIRPYLTAIAADPMTIRRHTKAMERLLEDLDDLVG
jgi:hypothetical protein